MTVSNALARESWHLDDVAEELGVTSFKVRELLQDAWLGFSTPSDPSTHQFSRDELASLAHVLRLRSLPEWARLPDDMTLEERSAVMSEINEQLDRDFD